MTAWFRRPDGVLVAAIHPAQVDRCLGRGYMEVDEAAAVEEIEAGKQAELNAARAADDLLARERRLATERQRKAEDRRTAARRVVSDACLETTPPQPPEAGPEVGQAVRDESGTVR